jgi:hypothetical protein
MINIVNDLLDKTWFSFDGKFVISLSQLLHMLLKIVGLIFKIMKNEEIANYSTNLTLKGTLSNFTNHKHNFKHSGLRLKKILQRQSNSVITNRSGPAIFVRYNRINFVLNDPFDLKNCSLKPNVCDYDFWKF